MSIIPYNGKNIGYVRENRKNPTKAEGLVWNMILKGYKTGAKFMRQRMFGPYIVDFYCKELKIVIEIDGETHNYKQEYDERRIKYLKSLGFEVFVYTDEKVLGNLEGVCEDINRQVKNKKTMKLIKNTSPMGRKATKWQW